MSPCCATCRSEIEPGEVLGLLGRTGSGKTTISRLLFRLHDPLTRCRPARRNRHPRCEARRAARAHRARHAGRPALPGHAARQRHALRRDGVGRRGCATVFAELGLDEWLRDSAGRPGHTSSAPAARGLSAGEAQLVALARVFLKDPGLVVLDEASSRLDPATERLLEHAISRLLDGRTGVVIAHRLATVERADRILILEDGARRRARRAGPSSPPIRTRASRNCCVPGMAEVLA